MPDQKISQLPIIASLAQDLLIPGISSEGNVKIPILLLEQLASGGVIPQKAPANGVLGSPTNAAVYYAIPGNYTLPDNSTVTIPANTIAFFFWNKTQWTNISMTLPTPTTNIVGWAPGPYLSGTQVKYGGKVWEATAAAPDNDVPGAVVSGVTTVWKEILNGYATQKDTAGESLHLTYVPNTALSAFGSTSSATLGKNFANVFPTIGKRVIDKITIQCNTAGQVAVTKISSSGSIRDIVTLNTILGVNDYYLPSTPLIDGDLIGLRVLSGSIPFVKNGGVGLYDGGISTIDSGFELAYIVNGHYVIPAAYSTLPALTEAVTAIINSHVSYTPLNPYSVITVPNGLGVNYYNAYDSGRPRVITKINLASTANAQIVVVKFSATNVATDVVVLTGLAGTNDYVLPTPVSLSIGESLGLRILSGSVYHTRTGGVGMYAGDAGTVVAGYEMSYSYYGYYTDNTTYTPLSTLTKQVEGLLAVPPNKVELFGDDMSTQKVDWQLTGWSYAIGAYTSTATGMSNRLNLNRQYHIDKRTGRFLVKLSADSDLRLHCNYGVGNNGEGASMVGINASTGTLNIYTVNGATSGVEPYTSKGVQEMVVLTSQNIGFSIDTTRTYLIELVKDDLTLKLNFYDTISGNSAMVSYTGWSAGRQNENYGFYVYSGGAVSITHASVVCPYQPDLTISGDSITEGVYVMDDRTKRWADVLRSLAYGITVISARGGSTIDDIINKFATEYSIYRPKRLMVLIGANGGNTTAKIQQVVTLCAQYGIQLYWNSNTCQQSGDVHVSLNAMLAPFNFKGCKFDIATALQNYPNVDSNHLSPRYNMAIYADAGLHPNQTGQVEMVKRFALDVPELLKTYN